MTAIFYFDIKDIVYYIDIAKKKENRVYACFQTRRLKLIYRSKPIF
jgi:hypothetical protein